MKTNWMALILLLYAVPALGIGVSLVIRSQLNADIRVAIATQHPDVPAQHIARVDLDTICEPPTSEGLRELCATNANLALMRQVAVVDGGVGLALLVLIALMARMATRSRAALAALFRPGFYLTMLTLMALMLLHAAVAMAAIYYGESFLFGQVHPYIILGIGIGSVLGLLVMAQGTLSLVGKAKTTVQGDELSREQAPELWRRLEDLVGRLGAQMPRHLVVGLDPTLFVTNADVVCSTGTLSGPTLYVSLPLCRILTVDELLAFLAHEFAHFHGAEAAFSRDFCPVFRGTSTAIATLRSTTKGIQSFPLLPAVAVLSHFIESFTRAESDLSGARELSADQHACSVVGPRTFAAALAKVLVFEPVRNTLRDAAAEALRAGEPFTNPSVEFARLALATASSEDEADITNLIGDIQAAAPIHPTDSHPPLQERLDALRLSIADVAADALNPAPRTPASELFGNIESEEEKQGVVYWQGLAQELGLPSPGMG